MERVITLEGEAPIIVIAPHGVEHDDSNTAFIAERIAKEIGAFAVINQGWERASDVDFIKSHANCNDVRHLHEDVVREEFLDPILRYVNRIDKDFGFAYMMVVHGMGNYVRQYTEDGRLDIIIGYGAGTPPIYSCDTRLKDAFIHYLTKSGICTYEGMPGSQFAGRSKNNLNQLFRRWYPNSDVHSMQIEIVKELREELDIAEITAVTLAECMDDLIYLDDTQQFAVNTKLI